jgi:hypothetical protein
LIAFAYGDNYLIDTKAAIIVDVEPSPARWTAEVAATRTMIERTKERFGLQPKKLAADTAYGSGGNLAWLMERRIVPHIPILDRTSQTNGSSHATTSPTTASAMCSSARAARICGFIINAQTA